LSTARGDDTQGEDTCARWRLEQRGDGTRISVDVEIPEAEAGRLDSQRHIISTSMRRLAELASGAR
jgi:hypothetical protein